MNTCFIFPKAFEASTYILQIRGRIKYSERLGHWDWLLNIYESNLVVHAVRIKVIEDSDFGFYQKILKLSRDYHYVLIGSCGFLGPPYLTDEINRSKEVIKKCVNCDKDPLIKDENESKMMIEEVSLFNDVLYKPFFITSATKYDRGRLHSFSNGERFEPDPKKQLTIFMEDSDVVKVINKSNIAPKSLPILSSNFVCNSKFKPLVRKDVESENYLVDMETFEFLKICKDLDLSLICVVRVVSDVVGDNQDFKRCLFDMGETVPILDYIISVTSKRRQYVSEPLNFQLESTCLNAIEDKIKNVVSQIKDKQIKIQTISPVTDHLKLKLKLDTNQYKKMIENIYND